MWGGTPQGGGYGGAPAPDPRRALATALGLVVVFFGLPVFVAYTGPWVRVFIATRYTREWMDIGMAVYWIIAGLALLQLSRIAIWLALGVLVASLARMMARAR